MKVFFGVVLYSLSIVNMFVKFKLIVWMVILYLFGLSVFCVVCLLSFKFCKLFFLEIFYVWCVVLDVFDVDVCVVFDVCIVCFFCFVFVVVVDVGGCLFAWVFIASASGVGGTTRFEG